MSTAVTFIPYYTIPYHIIQQLDLRLTCLSRECDSRSQCYLLDEAAEAITMAPTMRIEMYVTAVTTKIDQTGMESAMGQWLNIDPSYVSAVL